MSGAGPHSHAHDFRDDPAWASRSKKGFFDFLIFLINFKNQTRAQWHVSRGAPFAPATGPMESRAPDGAVTTLRLGHAAAAGMASKRPVVSACRARASSSASGRGGPCRARESPVVAPTPALDHAAMPVRAASPQRPDRLGDIEHVVGLDRRIEPTPDGRCGARAARARKQVTTGSQSLALTDPRSTAWPLASRRTVDGRSRAAHDGHDGLDERGPATGLSPAVPLARHRRPSGAVTTRPATVIRISSALHRAAWFEFAAPLCDGRAADTWTRTVTRRLGRLGGRLRAWPSVRRPRASHRSAASRQRGS